MAGDGERHSRSDPGPTGPAGSTGSAGGHETGRGTAQPAGAQPPRFILDVHLGKLAAYLRLLGFDTLYRNDYEDTELARTAQAEGRILLTRDGPLLRNRFVRAGYRPQSVDPLAQAREVLDRFALRPLVHPWTRCIRCNGELHPIAKAEILPLLQPKTRLYYESFRRCGRCGRIYWEGTHFQALKEKLRLLGVEP
jgi:uncharacterized protein with PIN domain